MTIKVVLLRRGTPKSQLEVPEENADSRGKRGAMEPTEIVTPLLSTEHSPSGCLILPCHFQSSSLARFMSTAQIRTPAHSKGRPEFGFAIGLVRVCRDSEALTLRGEAESVKR